MRTKDGCYTSDPAEAVAILTSNAGARPSADNSWGVLNFFSGPGTARTWTAANPAVPVSILTATAVEHLAQYIFGTLFADQSDRTSSSAYRPLEPIRTTT